MAESAEVETISMVSCPICKTAWVREDSEYTCQDCVPTMLADLALSDLLNSIKKLETINSKYSDVDMRIDILISAHHKFTKLIKKIGN